MITAPALYHSKKTNTHWMIHSIEGEQAVCSEQITGGYEMFIPLVKLQAAIDSGVMTKNESASALLVALKNRAEKTSGRKRK